MKVTPILFQPEMVRAQLAGSKTKTRRLVKPQPEIHYDLLYFAGYKTGFNSEVLSGKVLNDEPNIRNSIMASLCPYGQPGDLLWVREKVAGLIGWSKKPSLWPHNPGSIFYFADDSGPKHLVEHRARWQPPMFMPKWASRLTLQLTEVRVERLQDISDEDCEAEGVRCCITEGRFNCVGDKYIMPYRDKYRHLWQSINGAASWQENPWVWVLGFKVLFCNINDLLNEKGATNV